MTTTASKGKITITHTRAEGTTLGGSRKGDGVFEIVRGYGFWFSREPGVGLYIRQSRDKAAQTWKINPAAEALRAAGWDVEIVINEDERRSFADAEAERYERAEDRADRFAEYAGNASARAEAAYANVRRIADGIPFGQPILIGHHSEGRARRDVKRMDDGMRRSIQEQDKAKHYAGRAAAAEHYQQHRTNPGVTLRRIDKLEADLRRVERNLAGTGSQGWNPNNPDHKSELDRQRDELVEQLTYWRGVIAQAEADGFKLWGKSDFKKGDYALIGGRWYEVLRVNAKSLTVPGGPDIQPVISQETRAYSWNDTRTYDGVKARKSAEEMAAALAAAKDKAEQSS